MDDLDVEAMLDEAMLEEGITKESSKTSKSTKENGHNKSRSKRSPTPEKKRVSGRSRSKERTSTRTKESSRPSRRSRSKDRTTRRSRSKDRSRRSRSRERHRRRSRERVRSRRSRSPRRARRSSPKNSPGPDKSRRSYRDPYQRQIGLEKSPERRRPRKERMTPEERDARTVFCMQVSQRIRPSDLEEFFSSVGKVQDVRVITDNKTRRSKGIAYIEFAELESVSLALGLDGQKLLGVPIIVQASQAEKNRAVPVVATSTVINKGPMRLYVGNLHQNITEDMMTGIFEPFGALDTVTLIKNETGNSKGYGFVTFKIGDDALKAIEQLNGFELAGRCMKLHQHGNEATSSSSTTNMNGQSASEDGQIITSLDVDDTEKKGFDLGATGRLALMAKLAQGTDIKVPTLPSIQNNQNSVGDLTTQCFMLSNMFSTEDVKDTTGEWPREIADDIIEECDKHGGCLHVYVNRTSHSGEVYVKCPSVRVSGNVVNSLHGRYFAGKQITAAYVPIVNYHTLFPGTTRSTELLKKHVAPLQTVMAAIPPPPSYGV